LEAAGLGTIKEVCVKIRLNFSVLNFGIRDTPFSGCQMLQLFHGKIYSVGFGGMSPYGGNLSAGDQGVLVENG